MQAGMLTRGGGHLGVAPPALNGDCLETRSRAGAAAAQLVTFGSPLMYSPQNHLGSFFKRLDQHPFAVALHSNGAREAPLSGDNKRFPISKACQAEGRIGVGSYPKPLTF